MNASDVSPDPPVVETILAHLGLSTVLPEPYQARTQRCASDTPAFFAFPGQHPPPRLTGLVT